VPVLSRKLPAVSIIRPTSDQEGGAVAEVIDDMGRVQTRPLASSGWAVSPTLPPPVALSKMFVRPLQNRPMEEIT
jgi:hypothetical protein